MPKKILITILIVLTLLVLLAVLSTLVKKPPQKSTGESVTSLPTQIVSPGVRNKIVPISPQPAEIVGELPQSTLSKLIAELPYETDNYLIEYYPYEKVLLVSMKQPNEEPIQKAINWLLQKGISDPENNRQIVFSYYKEQ